MRMCIWCKRKPQNPLLEDAPEFCSMQCADDATEWMIEEIAQASAHRLKKVFERAGLTGRGKEIGDSIILDALHEEGGSAIDPREFL